MSSFSLFSRRSTISSLFTWFSSVFLPSCLHDKGNIRLTTQKGASCVGPGIKHTSIALTHLHGSALQLYSGTSVSLKRRFKVSLESLLPRRRSRSRSSRSLAWRTFCSSSVASVLAFTAWGRSGGQGLLQDPKANLLFCLCNSSPQRHLRKKCTKRNEKTCRRLQKLVLDSVPSNSLSEHLEI